jgi:radical SAM superfamily enzyme YgiQ (UPF0313 family)
MNADMIFVFPPAVELSDVEISEHFNICLGTAYIIAYLVEKGFSAGAYLTGEPVNVRKCAAQILAMKPRIVGFTVYEKNYCFCQLIARALKEANPNIIIVFGGPTPTVQAGSILEDSSFVDICVRNEGEETCLELMTILVDAGFDWKKTLPRLEKVRGITYRADGSFIETPGRNFLSENIHIPDCLDKYPSPYLSGVLRSCGPGMLTARGCNQHCVYCNCAVMSGRTVATHSVDRVIQELDYVSKKLFDPAKEDSFVIYDDAFTLLPGRALEICKKIIENKIKLPMISITRCDKVSEELLDAMKEAGFVSIGFSLESAVPRVLRQIGKMRPANTQLDPTFEKEKKFIQQFKKYTAYTKKIGVECVFASMITGLPTETLEEGQQTTDLIRSLGENIDYYAHNFLRVYAGTPIFDNYDKFGLKLRWHDNRIHIKTIHPYDVSKIRLAPRSNLELDGIHQDKINMKTLALVPSKKAGDDYFNKVILWADAITEKFVAWLRECLAINGNLIQVYTGVETARQRHDDDVHALTKYISPTSCHMSYYQTRGKDGTITLRALRMSDFGDSCGKTIALVNTGTAFSPGGEGINPMQTLCIEREEEDALCLHRLLLEVSHKGDVRKKPDSMPVYPYFCGLCRWEKGHANCNALDTIIVEFDGTVKTCMNGAPIGTVGTPFPALVENLENIRRGVEQKRGCQDCEKQEECPKCVFPQPLTDSQYCELKREPGVGEAARRVRDFDFLKAL